MPTNPGAIIPTSNPNRVLLNLNLVSIGFAILLLLFSLALLMLEAEGTAKVLPSVVAGFLASPKLGVETLFFGLAVIGIHIALATGWHLLWRPIAHKLFNGSVREVPLALLSFLPVLLLIILTNHTLYPNSNFSFSLPSAPAEVAITSIWVITLLYFAGVLIVSTWFGLRSLKRLIAHGRLQLVATAVPAAAIIVLAAGVHALHPLSASDGTATERNQPDVLLIGVDSIRTDHVGFLNGLEQSLTPAMDDFLANASVFEHAWTPLGRTYPAWVSILTGQYPSTHGAVFNLVARERVEDHASLAHQLGEAGYQRIYAIDETRFSNIDESYGFDEVIAPAIGASDFLLGTVGDIPTVNLLANTALGRLLFPNIHMNRAVTRTYRPGTFDHALERSLEALDASKPLFLAAHFELPHWPYVWSNWENVTVDAPEGLELDHNAYHAAIARTDAQVGRLLQVLEREGRLKNAIVILLSDHGEAFHSVKPQWRAQGEVGPSRVPTHAGHGTSVISESQNNVILGFRGYGPKEEMIRTSRDSDTTVSLVDIRPTLHGWLDIPLPQGLDLEGHSLLPALVGNNPSRLTNRVITLETGFSLPSIEAGNPDSEAIIQEAVEYYDVATNGRLEMQEHWVLYLMGQKQRAALSGRWILGAFPANIRGSGWRLTLADFETHRYWNARDRENLPAEAPIERLLTQLCSRFKADPGFDLDECLH